MIYAAVEVCYVVGSGSVGTHFSVAAGRHPRICSTADRNRVVSVSRKSWYSFRLLSTSSGRPASRSRR